jgi:ATP-binding cassette subfamily B protein
MREKVKVTGADEIADAMQFIERNIASQPDVHGKRICMLVCEELLKRLLRIGCREISVSVRGHFFRHMEISAFGDRADDAPLLKDDPEDRFDAQINEGMLEYYEDHYVFRYRNGVNLYKVYYEKRDIIDLTDEIYGFYENPDTASSHKPMSAIWHIAGNHRGFVLTGILILLMRHLGALLLPVFASNIINIVTETGSFFEWNVLMNIFLSVLSLCLNLVCFWMDSHCYRRFARAVEAGFRMALVQKLQVLSVRFHRSTQSGVVLSKVASDVQFIEMLIYDRLIDILFLTEDVLFIFAVALTTFPLMLVFYIVIVPVAAYLIHRFSRPLQESRAGMRKKNEQVSAATNELLRMEDLTRSHGLEKSEYRSMLKKVRSAQRASVMYDRQTVSVNNVTYGGFQGLKLLSVSFAALLLTAGYINVGTLVLFQSIFEMMINNVQKLLDSVPLFVQGYDSLVSVNEILFESDIEHNGTKLPDTVQGGIEFRHVSFGYDSEKDSVLRDISFSIPAGRSIAIAGRSGQGKSTVMNLILGLYSAKEGEILIDGVNMDELDKTAYRRNVAVVPQNTVLFAGTLWDNLVYGLSYVSTDKVMDVINRVGLQDILEMLPDGLNSMILENGGNLSGGQKQRIAIARALLRDPKIILLDEATSALDDISERRVQEAINAMIGSCTVVMAAHRLGTLRRADDIYLMNNGRLEKCGSFEELTEFMGAGD